MTDTQPSGQVTYYLITNREAIPEPERASLKELSGIDAALAVGDVPDQMLVPINPDDGERVRKLVRAGWAAIVGTVCTAVTLANGLATRQFYFHPDTGRLVTLHLCTPLVLCFCLLNAGPGMAQYVLEDVETVIASGTTGVIYRLAREGDTLATRLVEASDAQAVRADLARDPDAPTPPEGPVDTTWVAHACALVDPEKAQVNHGTFPELTPAFVAAFETFQRRLCVRRLAQAEARFLYAPVTPTLEADLLARARQCGYWSDLAFSSFAYAYLVLGREALDSSANFVCHGDDVAATRALVDIQRVVTDAGLRRRALGRYGPDWDG